MGQVQGVDRFRLAAERVSGADAVADRSLDGGSLA
jgi:hypothetical protein